MGIGRIGKDLNWVWIGLEFGGDWMRIVVLMFVLCGDWWFGKFGIFGVIEGWDGGEINIWLSWDYVCWREVDGMVGFKDLRIWIEDIDWDRHHKSRQNSSDPLVNLTLK